MRVVIQCTARSIVWSTRCFIALFGGSVPSYSSASQVPYIWYSTSKPPRSGLTPDGHWLWIPRCRDGLGVGGPPLRITRVLGERGREADRRRPHERPVGEVVAERVADLADPVLADLGLGEDRGDPIHATAVGVDLRPVLARPGRRRQEVRGAAHGFEPLRRVVRVAEVGHRLAVAVAVELVDAVGGDRDRQAQSTACTPRSVIARSCRSTPSSTRSTAKVCPPMPQVSRRHARNAWLITIMPVNRWVYGSSDVATLPRW